MQESSPARLHRDNKPGAHRLSGCVNVSSSQLTLNKLQLSSSFVGSYGNRHTHNTHNNIIGYIILKVMDLAFSFWRDGRNVLAEPGVDVLGSWVFVSHYDFTEKLMC